MVRSQVCVRPSRKFCVLLGLYWIWMKDSYIVWQATIFLKRHSGRTMSATDCTWRRLLRLERFCVAFYTRVVCPAVFLHSLQGYRRGRSPTCSGVESRIPEMVRARRCYEQYVRY